MKKFIILLTILSLVIVMFSCKLQDDDGTTPVDPETITLTVTHPTSGDTLFTSSVYNITWTSNTTQKLIIEYTIDNGENWELIASDIENIESHIWSPVPNTQTSQGRVKITTADSSLSSISEGFFSIVRGTSKILTVVEPNGGELWKGSSIQTIKWISSGVDSVILEYTIDNGLNWNTITSNAPSTGFYNWNPIPNTPTTNAKVRVIDAEEGFPLDESDNAFTIEPEDLLTLTMPNGGEEWLAGSSQYIKWNTQLDISPGSAIPSTSPDELNNSKLDNKSTKTKFEKDAISSIKSNSSPKSIETIESVKIEYSVNGAASWITIIESTPNSGIYFWQSLPSENSANCLIRVSDASDGVPFDFNEVAFSIYASLPQEIEIISPNGGEGWAAGTSQEIKWSSKDVSFVKIEYTTNNGVNWNTIVESTPSDGFYTWEQLPNGAASNCRIKISDATDGSPSDMSNELFSITPEPSINLISPNGGETLQSGSSINITWTSVNIAKIKIEYTINGGAEWKLVADNVESTGTYTWENIPDVNSSQVKIKISDADDGAPFDISESNLAISNQIVQSLEVTSPNGGEVWEASTSKNVTWNSSAITHVKIEYTINGMNWVVVEDSLPSAGSYDWHVPNVNSTQAKIRISDAIDGDPIDESNSTFRIKQAGTIKLISPKSGDNLVAGELIKIEWTSENVEKVKIEYTTTNDLYNPGAVWFNERWFELVTNAPGATGFYETKFTIPSSEYNLRISDAEFNEPVDFSGLFTVADLSVSGYPASIHLVSTSLPSIGIKGGGDPETVNLVFEVQDSNAVPVDKNHITNVTFSIEPGNPGGGEFLSPITGQTDAFGRVTVSLSSGTIAGPVRVKATLNSNGTHIESTPIPISIHGGWPDAAHFSIASQILNYPYFGDIGEEIEFLALVGDEYSNPVKPNTTVYFSTDAGVIEGSGFTDALGRVTSTLVSGAPFPNDPDYGHGYFYVYANTIDKTSANIETKTLRLFSGRAIAPDIIPNTINVPNDGSQSFTYTVADVNGNPLAEGNKYSVSLKSDGDVDISGETNIEMSDVLSGFTTFGFTLFDTVDTLNVQPITIKIEVEGPNGKTSATIIGTTN